jgi:hypothetical protein
VKRALALLCLVAVAGAGERVILETEVSRDTCYVHERFRLKLRIAYDRGFFEKHAVQMFSRELDVPVQVRAPWLDALDGAILRRDAATAGASLALNDTIVEGVRGGDREVDGRAFAVVEITRTCVPLRAGELVLEAPRLRFAHATRFEEDFVHGRMALDRRDAVVVGRPRTLLVRALPEEGRPVEFTGAVGHGFEVHAEATPRSLEVGAVLELVLRIEGEGDLGLFDPPPLNGLSGAFHVYGSIDEKGATRRTITYDVAPLHAAVTEVPAIAFAWFDPRDPAGYRTVRSAPIPLTVADTGRSAQPEPPPAASSSPAALVAVLVLAVALAVLLWARARRRRAPEPDPAAAFHAHVGTDVAAALTAYLAARLQCRPAAVIGPDLAARLAAAGVPDSLATRTALLLEGLVATRYGATAPEDRAEDDARALVEELEAAFQ